jgi:hypothetical protein
VTRLNNIAARRSKRRAIPLAVLAAKTKEGEALDFIPDGHIELYGELPLNTFGGSLGTGRIHSLWHIIEGALQGSGRARSRTPTFHSSAPAPRS